MNKIIFTPDGKNRTPEIVKSLINAPDGTSLIFEKGVYDFYMDGVYEDYFNPGCNTSSDKKIVFPLINLNNITIDGGGSRFIFHDRLFPFIIKNCENVEIKSFSVDFSFPRYMIADVAAVNEDGFELVIDDSVYNYSVNSSGNILIYSGTHEFNSCEMKLFLKQGLTSDAVCCYLKAGKGYFDTTNLAAEMLTCTAEKTEKGVYLKFAPENTAHCGFKTGSPLIVSFDERRENDNFYFEKSSDIILENIRIYHGAGMGFTGTACHNFTLKSCEVAPENPGKLNYYSTTADAALLTNFTGKVVFDGCHIQNTMDDAFSIHGFYAKAERISSPKKAIFRLVHASQSGTRFLFKDDVITVTDGKTSLEKGTAKIKSAYFEADLSLIHVTFYDEIEDILSVGDYIDNPDRTPEVHISNCFFEDACHLRLGTSKKVIFENNTLKDSGGIFINDLMTYWAASGLSTDVLIQNNTFIHCNTPIHAFIDRVPNTGVRHKNIKIINNDFKNCNHGIIIKNTDGVYINGNTFSGIDDKYTIIDCENVDIDD